ncbi:MAG: purine-binding chemotaxis protein CheW [Armatimonadetes bacterium]|nr:purine-binding chemotaxis protein CheW [Armatimonadota bacterium]
MAIEATTMAPRSKAEAGLYLSFRLAAEEYGISILSVREIIGLQPITAVPQAPAAVLGVINLRGKVIPVVSLRTMFGLPDVEATAQSCIIVLDITHLGLARQVGVLVDEVAEVANLEAREIEPAPDLGAGAGQRYVKGVGLLGKRVMMLLDAGDMLSDQISVDALSAAM